MPVDEALPCRAKGLEIDRAIYPERCVFIVNADSWVEFLHHPHLSLHGAGGKRVAGHVAVVGGPLLERDVHEISLLLEVCATG